MQHVLSREGMGSRDKRLHCVLDWGYVGGLGMSKETGGPAFPQFGFLNEDGCNRDSSDAGGTGLTLRDHFAGLAMQGILVEAGCYSASGVAKEAYEMADAMLEVRNK